mmetsp:Transcript_815/g.1513  ORF Transcript_815/g.1513 Transcript_815/m.1513 type:complete len:80 (+) Transcript_815:225-464(+)
MHTLEWNACFIFDGCRSEAKAPEYARREGKLGNESTCIALAAKVRKEFHLWLYQRRQIPRVFTTVQSLRPSNNGCKRRL